MSQPVTDFGKEATPDEVYVHADILTHVPQPLTDDPGEMALVLAYLARHGHDIPPEVLARDHTHGYEPHAAVAAAWQRIYATRDGADAQLRLGEALTEIAELIWRMGAPPSRQGWGSNDHLDATPRAMGGKTGTGGSSGVAWLKNRAQRHVFPELWTARSDV